MSSTAKPRTDPSDYQVAICTHRRADTLAAKTLPLLLSRGVHSSRVVLFVADHEDLSAYARFLADGLVADIVETAPGLRLARLAASLHYDPGTPVVYADDDLTDVVQVAPDGKTLEPVFKLSEFFTAAFTRLHDTGLCLWGVAPVPNAFYLRPGKVSEGLRFCVGSLWGRLSRPGQPVELLDLDEKEDYERCLRAYLTDGGVVRFGDVSVKTSYYTEPGGMQTYRTDDDSHAAAAHLISTYPGLVRLNWRRKGPRAEVLLTPKPRRTLDPSAPVSAASGVVAGVPV